MVVLGLVGSRIGHSRNGHVRNGRSRIGRSRNGTSTPLSDRQREARNIRRYNLPTRRRTLPAMETNERVGISDSSESCCEGKKMKNKTERQ